MREEIAVEEVKKTKYYCDFCKSTSVNKEWMEYHEKTHDCKHESVEFIYEDEDGYYGNVPKGIIKRCSRCHTNISSVDFDDLDDHSSLLERVYHIIAMIEEYKR